MLNENEYTEVEGRLYPNPQVSLDESLSFIDNLRATQGQQNQEIAQQTRNLGTDVPSNLGGLIGGEGYFTSRYQTPQTASVAASLRATAQAAALNQALENEQAKWKKRYQDAYNAYQKRAWNRGNSSGGGTSGVNGGADDEEKGDTEFNSTTSTVNPPKITGKDGYYSVVDIASGNIVDVPFESNGGSVRDANRYIAPLDAGYALMGTPWMGAGTPGQHMYSTPTGDTIYVNLDEGYKIRYDTETGKLVQVKE